VSAVMLGSRGYGYTGLFSCASCNGSTYALQSSTRLLRVASSSVLYLWHAAWQRRRASFSSGVKAKYSSPRRDLALFSDISEKVSRSVGSSNRCGMSFDRI
jgi:hypothetical protein